VSRMRDARKRNTPRKSGFGSGIYGAFESHFARSGGPTSRRFPPITADDGALRKARRTSVREGVDSGSAAAPDDLPDLRFRPFLSPMDGPAVCQCTAVRWLEDHGQSGPARAD
jgi:hypothetical protein